MVAHLHIFLMVSLLDALHCFWHSSGRRAGLFGHELLLYAGAERGAAHRSLSPRGGTAVHATATGSASGQVHDPNAGAQETRAKGPRTAGGRPRARQGQRFDVRLGALVSGTAASELHSGQRSRRSRSDRRAGASLRHSAVRGGCQCGQCGGGSIAQQDDRNDKPEQQQHSSSSNINYGPYAYGVSAPPWQLEQQRHLFMEEEKEPPKMGEQQQQISSVFASETTTSTEQREYLPQFDDDVMEKANRGESPHPPVIDDDFAARKTTTSTTPKLNVKRLHQRKRAKGKRSPSRRR